ncbi:hypothetical protein FCM35_KLT19339 [Carex littledalei]|uniref:Uncharacterized protein n=1 Tax=Carex littledalei TaxID=544730 RepID=A0A833RBR3_9POAL|nr:hypothetical protein FCM35_KLT19339 [Carex littledalei]
MDPHNKKWKRDRDGLPPTLTLTGAAHLSLPIRRWQRTLLEIRNDRCLLHSLLRRLHTRAGGDIFLRLFHVRLEDTFRRVALVHPMENNMSLSINGGPPVVGSGSSEPNPHENDTIEGLAQLDTANNQVPLEEMLANTESTSDNIFQCLSKSDSFDPDMCDVWVQEFISSLLNSGDVGPPLTPRRKRKVKALFRSVAFVSVIRKRVRIVPPPI